MLEKVYQDLEVSNQASLLRKKLWLVREITMVSWQVIKIVVGSEEI